MFIFYTNFIKISYKPRHKITKICPINHDNLDNLVTEYTV
jgi:hypothetical protein